MLRVSNGDLPFPPHPSGSELKGAVGGVPHRARIGRALFHRARSASTGAPHPRSPLFLSLFNLARRDLTGGADLGARPPAAGSLHRAGREDRRAGQRQDSSTYTAHTPTFFAAAFSAGATLSERRQ